MSVYFRTASVAVAVFGLLVSTARRPFRPARSEPQRPVRGRAARHRGAHPPLELRDWDRRVDGMLRERRAARPADARGPARRRAHAPAGRSVPPGRARVRRGRRAPVARRGDRVRVRHDLRGDRHRSRTRRSTRIARARSSRSGPAHDSTRPCAPELVVLPLDAGGYALTWRLRVTTRTDARQYFIDARTGAAVLDYSDRKGQSAVGRARGVLGDTKKISVRSNAGQFVTSDELRPAVHPDLRHAGRPVSRRRLPQPAHHPVGERPRVRLRQRLDRRRRSATRTSTPAGPTTTTSSASAGAGSTTRTPGVQSLVHPVRRAGRLHVHRATFPDFFINAFYAGDGVMVFGEGLPAGVTLGGQTWDFLSGALDIVAHELTHGVTEFTSNLIYRNESGRAERVLLGHDGHRRGVLLPAAGQRRRCGPTT